MKNIYDIILENAAFYDATMNEMKIKLFAKELAHVSPEELERAFGSFRKEAGRRLMPMPGDILGFLKPGPRDNRPGVEEAWSLCPRTESETAVWTAEARDAFFGAALKLIDEDHIAARMAFKEKYTQLVAEARAGNVPAKWQVSLGHDKIDRERKIVKAVQKGFLPAAEARKLLPDISFVESRTQPRLQGPESQGLKQITGETDAS
jgi:hypothetical protein